MEMLHIRQELVMMHKRNCRYLATTGIAGIICAIVANAAQFYYTFSFAA